MQDAQLWKRIEDFNFPKGFEEKLTQRVGGWTGPMRKIREEYRRFVYLAMIADFEVTPSEAVDQAWHLHLSYTRDYWERFCPKVLQRDFHHEPCESAEAMPRYSAQYAQTLALYEREFGVVPPIKVWPTKTLSRRFWGGVAIAGLGVVVGTIGIAAGDGTPNWGTHSALALLVGGLTYATFQMPYGRTEAAGCGGGSAAGCGGGGCGS